MLQEYPSQDFGAPAPRPQDSPDYYFLLYLLLGFFYPRIITNAQISNLGRGLTGFGSSIPIRVIIRTFVALLQVGSYSFKD